MHRILFIAARATVLIFGISAGCERRAQPESVSAPRGPRDATKVSSGAALRSPAAATGDPAADVVTTSGAAPPEAEPPTQDAVAGEWTETELFRFRVTGLGRCRTPGRGRTASVRPGEPPALAAAADDVARLAVTVEVQAHHDLFVSPRDVTLDRGGVIYPSELVSARERGCGRLLRPESLRAGESARGAVVFALPEAEARAAMVVFAPTRWGGAPRAAVAVPDCLDACERAGRRARSPKARIPEDG